MQNKENIKTIRDIVNYAAMLNYNYKHNASILRGMRESDRLYGQQATRTQSCYDAYENFIDDCETKFKLTESIVS
jgi:hypothetical protein